MSIAKWKMPGSSRCSPVWAERRRRAAPAGIFTRVILCGMLLALMAGCVATRPAPVADRLSQKAKAPAKPPARATPVPDPARPEFYTVKTGDTLYSIALEFGLDYRELATWNGIDPSRIRVGQQSARKPEEPLMARASPDLSS